MRYALSTEASTATAMYTLKINNFGKIERGEVQIADFTVFAGPNNTGKSFVSKLLYSLFNAANVDLTLERLRRLTVSLRPQLRHLSYEERPLSLRLRRFGHQLETTALSYSGHSEQLEDVVTQLQQVLAKMTSQTARVARSIRADTDDRQRRRLKISVEELLDSLEGLYAKLEEAKDIRAFGLAELRHRIGNNLTQNFQVSEVTSLRGDQGRDVSISVDDALSMTIREGGAGIGIDTTEFGVLDEVSNVIYLESPIYWKLFRALVRPIPSFYRSRSGRDTLTGVPGYFYDLAESLTFDYSGEVAYPDVLNDLTSSAVIGGSISISDRGEMTFEEAGRSYPLPTVATGVANIGILAALIERKIVDRGTMLFIDEPEAHLHPSWQVVMADALFKLAKGGVKVVIATHSPDILKWLDVRMRKNPDDQSLLALNQFPNPRHRDDPLDVQIAQIKQSLTRPFLDLYLEQP